MADEAHRWTDGEIERLEKRFRAMYRQASKEMGEKLEKLMEGYDDQRQAWLKMVRNGEKTQQEYKEWLRGLSTRHRYVSGMADTLARDATRTNKLARDAINDALPRVFAENANRAAFGIEKQLGWDTHSFDLVDESTVRRLMALPSDGQILKEVTTDESIVDPPLVTMRKINFKEAKDVRWNRQKFNSAITQGILQGESVPNVAKRLKQVLNMDKGMAAKAARTAMTSAENAGRTDSYKRAKDIGIELEQQWIATLDGRTRHSHRHLDGEHVPVGEKFSNGLEYPGDPEGRPEEVWNCRCTLVAWFPGIEQEDPERWSKLPKGMTYEDWREQARGRLEARRGTVTPAPAATTSADSFVSVLDAAKASCPAENAWRVDTTRTAEDFNRDKVTMYVTTNGSTFALKDDGDIISVCKNQITDKGTNAKSLMAAAVENGGTHLDSFDGNFGFYVKCGFEPVSRCQFSKEFAPDGWTDGRDDEEDIYFMRYVGVGNVKLDTKEKAREAIPYSEGYDEAEAVIKRLLKGL